MVKPMESTPELRRALQGDRAWLTGVCRRLSADLHEAEDLEQELWLALLRRPPRPGSSLRAWMAGVLRRLAALGRRRRQREADRLQMLEGERGGEVASTLEELERAELGGRVSGALSALREPYASVLALRYLEGLTPQAIARREGTNASTVRAQLTRGRELLRQRLADEAPSAIGQRRWLVLGWGPRLAAALCVAPLVGIGLSTLGDGPVGSEPGEGTAQAPAQTVREESVSIHTKLGGALARHIVVDRRSIGPIDGDLTVELDGILGESLGEGGTWSFSAITTDDENATWVTQAEEGEGHAFLVRIDAVVEEDHLEHVASGLEATGIGDSTGGTPIP